MNQYNVVIDSAASVRKSLKESIEIDAKEQLVRKIMRDKLGMRYKKIQTVSFKGNTPKNLVLRQQFALKLIEQLSWGYNIINVDETWLGMTDWRRRKWQAPGTTNSISKKIMVPRLSMILGLDIFGTVYMSVI